MAAIVWLKSPQSSGTFITLSGKMYNMSAEPLEVTAEEAAEIIPFGFRVVE